MARARSAASERSESSDAGCPSILIVPADGRSSVPRTWRSVDLPEPDGPTIAMSSPSSIESETPRSAATSDP